MTTPVTRIKSGDSHSSVVNAPPWFIPLVLGCFFVSGTTGLVYEVLWGKYLALFIGVTSYAHTIVLATFMGGLAFGNTLFGRLIDRKANPLRLYGILELGIGVYAAFFPSLFGLLSRVYLAIAVDSPGSYWNTLLKVLLSAVAILPPTVLMGGTLPVLVRFVVRALPELGRSLAFLYFVNSAGAALGCLVAGFWLVASFGLDASMMIGACTNVTIGLLFLRLHRMASSGHAESQDSNAKLAQSKLSEGRARLLLLLVFVAGALSMVYELVWIRLLSLVLGSSTYAFSLMLFTFISGIAAGGYIVSRLLRQPRNLLLLFGLCELAVFAYMLLMLPLYERLPYWFNVLASMLSRTASTFWLYHIMQIVISFLVMLAPCVFIGMALPLAGAITTESLSVLGTRVGTVFSVNTLGNLVGATSAGFLLIPWLGLQSSLELAILCSGLVGATALSCLGSTNRGAKALRWFAAVVCIYVVAQVLLSDWDRRILDSGVFRIRTLQSRSSSQFRKLATEKKLLYHADGRELTVAVFSKRNDTTHRWLTVNGKTDASTGPDMSTQSLLGHLPLLLKPDSRRVFIVGLGSAVTAGAVMKHPIEACDVAEISPKVVAASHFFEAVNGKPLEDPRLRLYVADAREALMLTSSENYDVIISEPSNPWIAGIGNLFTVEFYQIVRRALKSDGMFVQWVQLYETDNTSLNVVLNTLSDVFSHVTVWNPNPADAVLIASMHAVSPEFHSLNERIQTPAVQDDLSLVLEQPQGVDPLLILSLQVLSSERFKRFFPGTGRLNRDRFPFLEYHAPKAFFVGENARLLSIDERSLARSQNALYLADYLDSVTLSDTAMARVAAFLGSGNQASYQRLSHGLAFRLLRGSSESETMSAATSITSRDAAKLYAKFGSPALLGNHFIWERIADEGDLTADEWRAYISFLAGKLAMETSVFATADTTEFASACDSCAANRCDSSHSLAFFRDSVYSQLGMSQLDPPFTQSPGRGQ